ncbi:MAG: amino acid adenylation domain-containing protein [Pyrinomonadaceae bacterium]|nr:amino acid adenylation domain-containing protein [Pyrinomonadaceae bacterium]
MTGFPKGAGALSSEKSELFALLLKKKHIDLPQAQTIPRRTEAGPCQLSFAQQRLWFLDQFEPGSHLYNIPIAVRIAGQLDAAALEQSLNEIVRRHEALGTTFVTVNESPVQKIATTLSVALPLVDLSELPEVEREVEARRLAVEEAQRPFDLASGPLFRASLLRLNDKDHALLVTMHHIVSDGWSLSVLMRELTALYEAFSENQPSPLAELPIQYADYAAWQREWLSGEVLAEHLSYWKQQLAGAPTVLELPTDRPHPAVQSFRGAHQSLAVSKKVGEELKALSQREGATLFMTMLAAFQILLSRYTNQEDIVVGSPIAGRNRAETEGLIGYFINMLALRTDLSGDPTFRELLGRVREVALGAYAHQDMPFEKLVEELQSGRDIGRHPVFQVMFAVQNTPQQAPELSKLALRPLKLEGDSGTAKFDLALFVVEAAEGLRAVVEYSTDLFEAATITRMLGHFEQLLAGIVANPDQRLSELPLLTAAERHQLLMEWNNTASDYPKDRSIHELFEARVEQTPDAVAVVFEDQQLTYAELNRRANQVARRLSARGVGPEVRVGICMERSVEMIIGLLGILKAGGAYVPLDAAYPRERLSFMMKDAAVPVLITQQHLLERLPTHDAEVVCLETSWREIADECTDNLQSGAGAESLAYVIYTSGSTGVPKGVAVRHRSVVRLAKQTNYVDFSANEVFLQFAPVSFDASTFELWGCLLNGARLVVFPAHIPSLEELGQILQQHQVTILWLTAGLFHQMVDEHLQSLRGVRQLLAGGDVLSVSHVEKVLAELGECQLINGYGPTENTTFTCCYRMTAGMKLKGSVPIGRPIANTQVYVLDSHMQPVPVGVTGELYIGGDGLARGYLNRLELTSERFIAHPFGTEAEARLYKTGDLARYLADGNLEFLGRRDQQVKVRGYRIELGEIEAVLMQHPAVDEAVVVASEEAGGDKRLVAYLVTQEEVAPSASELRRYLKEKLPDYMLPAAFMVLSEMPLTPNGKVDRRALPAPGEARPEMEAGYVAPRNAVEDVVAGIWGEVLRVERVGVDDNFFELGGHSLLATQVISRVREAMRVEVPLRTLFEAPTVAELSQRLVAIEARPGQTEKIAKVLQRIKGMSPEDRRETLQRKKG